MARRTRTYVCFDADTDMSYYRLMEAWKANDNIEFDFNNAHDLNTLRQSSSEDTIKQKLRERMNNSKLFIVLIGENTKNLYKFVKWEIDLAIKSGLPIICVNLNNEKKQDENRCPASLKETLSITVPYKQKIIQHAIDKWPADHQKYKSEGKNGGYHYTDDFYKNFGE